jgi:hypothetical protein
MSPAFLYALTLVFPASQLIEQFCSSGGSLFSGLEILDGEAILFHFVFSDDNRVASSEFLSGFETLLDAEALFAGIDGDAFVTEFASDLEGVLVHAGAERNDVSRQLRKRCLLLRLQGEYEPIFADGEPDTRRVRSAELFAESVVTATSEHGTLRAEISVSELERRALSVYSMPIVSRIARTSAK